MIFEGWKIVRKGKEIYIEKAKDDEFEVAETKTTSEEDFLKKEFAEIPLFKIGLDGPITDVIQHRLDEIKRSLDGKAFLGAIILCGSTLEGVLLGIASQHPREFNTANSAPKDKEGKIKHFAEWSLSNFIDVAYELRLFHKDVKDYSHSLRSFRNYIHPFEQLNSQFTPTKDTAAISWQVLKAAFNQLADQKLKVISGKDHIATHSSIN